METLASTGIHFRPICFDEAVVVLGHCSNKAIRALQKLSVTFRKRTLLYVDWGAVRYLLRRENKLYQ